MLTACPERRRPDDGVPLPPRRLVPTLVLALVMASPALAQAPSLALPTEEEARGHAGLTVVDVPGRPIEVADVGPALAGAFALADRLPAERWELDALAADLGADPRRVHAFVRDHLAFDPYAGVLRGAEGALAARAANAWDGALLLAGLLEAAGLDTRFALGTLDDAAAGALLAAAAEGASVPLDDPPGADALGIDPTALVARARRDHGLLLGALAGRSLGGEEPSALAAVHDHVWVQVAAGDGVWRDVDPFAPFGETIATVERTSAALPDEAAHAVTVRVIAEIVDDGVLEESVLLEERLEAHDAGRRDLWLFLEPDAAGVGGTMASAMAGTTWRPTLLVDGVPRHGASFPVGGGGGGDDFFGWLSGGGPELVAVRLELESHAPGRTATRADRTLFDRAAPADRTTGQIRADALAPYPEEGVPAALAALHHVMVSTGGASPREFAIARALAANFAVHDLQDDDAATAFGLGDLLFPLAVVDRSAVLVSERLIVPSLAAGGGRAYVGRPRVYVASLSPDPGVGGGTARTIDLALDDVGLALPTGADASQAARHRLWYGVLQTALETELTLAAARAVDPATMTLVSVSLSMAGADLVLRSGDDGLAAAPAGPAQRSALEGGSLVVEVGGPDAFWAIDPLSGATRSVMEPGLRIGHVGGGNYTNAARGGPRFVVDPKTLNTTGEIRDGRYYRYTGKAPSRCSGGTEYVILLGCVSIPASMTVGMVTGVVITAIVSWATVVLEVVFLP